MIEKILNHLDLQARASPRAPDVVYFATLAPLAKECGSQPVCLRRSGGRLKTERDKSAANPLVTVRCKFKRGSPALMPQSSIFSFTEGAGVVEVGTRVRHLGRLDVGEGRVTNIHPDGHCDVEFAGCTFSWLPASSVYLAGDFQREQLRRVEQARMALEQARAREAQVVREKAAREELVRKIRAGFRLNDEELALLRGLSARDQMGIFASTKFVELVMDDLVPLLRRASADSSLRDALAAFWKARAPTAECLPLMPVAPTWWKERLWRAVRYAQLPLRGRLNVLSSDALQLSDGLRRELIQELVKEHAADESFDEALAQASPRLRFEVLVAMDGPLLQRFLDLALRLLLNAADPSASTLPSGLIDDFWKRHEVSIPRGSQLFALAPLDVRRRILRRHFHEHLMRLERLFGHNPENRGNWLASVVYAELDADDRKLAMLWCAGADSSHDIARMLSARAAEKVAAWFYVHLGFETTDVAIHQLSGKSAAWKTHDILLNGSKPVDVKNARLPVNNRAFYVEHTVPRFKRDRSGCGVTIVAVVSPYLSLTYIQDPNSAPFEVSDVRYLGETNLDAITRLCATFGSGALTVQHPSDGAFLPPWYFDFPDAWYRDFEIFSTQLRKAESPDENEMRLLYHGTISAFPIPKFLAARLALPSWLLEAMAPWMRAFVSQLQAACTPRPKLAHLFLLLLTDFLSKLQEDHVDSYEPSAYLWMLFEGGAPSESPSRQRPLGIEDPLDTIRTLCESLQQLWIAREQLELGRLEQYRLSGGGILQGRERRGWPWETVLSYCGGRVEGKGRCGYTPLILGVEPQCPACRKLVCPHCGHCSENCASVPTGTEH